MWLPMDVCHQNKPARYIRHPNERLQIPVGADSISARNIHLQESRAGYPLALPRLFQFSLQRKLTKKSPGAQTPPQVLTPLRKT